MRVSAADSVDKLMRPKTAGRLLDSFEGAEVGDYVRAYWKAGEGFKPGTLSDVVEKSKNRVKLYKGSVSDTNTYPVFQLNTGSTYGASTYVNAYRFSQAWPDFLARNGDESFTFEFEIDLGGGRNRHFIYRCFDYGPLWGEWETQIFAGLFDRSGKHLVKKSLGYVYANYGWAGVFHRFIFIYDANKKEFRLILDNGVIHTLKGLDECFLTPNFRIGKEENLSCLAGSVTETIYRMRLSFGVARYFDEPLPPMGTQYTWDEHTVFCYDAKDAGEDGFDWGESYRLISPFYVPSYYPQPNESGAFYFIKVDDGLWIADRDVQKFVSFMDLSSDNLIYGKKVTFKGRDCLLRSLNFREFYKYIISSDLNSTIINRDWAVWHVSPYALWDGRNVPSTYKGELTPCILHEGGPFTLVDNMLIQDNDSDRCRFEVSTRVPGETGQGDYNGIEGYWPNVDGIVGNRDEDFSGMLGRPQKDARYFDHYGLRPYCFRPVLEVVENKNSKTLFY